MIIVLASMTVTAARLAKKPIQIAISNPFIRFSLPSLKPILRNPLILSD
jgi:hypothetical protein